MSPDLSARLPNASQDFLRLNGSAEPLMGHASFKPFPPKERYSPQPLDKMPYKPKEEQPEAIALTLPFPISANNYWRTRVISPKSGARPMAVTYVTNEARKYKESVALLVGQQIKVPFTCEVKMEIKLYRPRKIGDTSNYTKVLEDALQGTCYVNDAQIGSTTSDRFDDKENPRVEVRIYPRPL